MISDGDDVEGFLRRFHDRCWLAGFGWMMVGAGGQFLERSLVDRMVFAPERLVFEGAPSLAAPLAQDLSLRKAAIQDGDVIAAAAACPPLTVIESAKLVDLKRAEKHRLQSEADVSKMEFIQRHARAISERRGISVAAAEKIAMRQTAGVLLPAVVLPFDVEEFSGHTVANVLAQPTVYAGATLADPLEGPDYGRCKAKIMRRSDGTAWINSFAHGRTTYDLKHDAASVEAAIMAAAVEDAANVLAQMLPVAELEADEDQCLRALVIQRAGIKAKPLAAKLKAAADQQRRLRVSEERERRAITRSDPRVYLGAPLPDAERLPVIQAIDEVLTGAKEPEPPMRDLDGHPIEVRARQPLALHELTDAGSNGDETKDTQFSAPEMPLLTRHDKCSLAHLIERYIEYYVSTERGGERSVALSPTFVEHFTGYRDSKLPRASAVVTNPLVLLDGSLLAHNGLDRKRKLVFRIPRELPPLIPAPAACCTDYALSGAMSYLLDEWLCDVSTDLDGKCVLLAVALSTLERVLLPERPAFFITAGQRGGGKTTATTMVIAAATGRRPAAAAWSHSDEERRKAILAYLSEGLPALVWDNIPRGTAISCPTIDKVLTAEQFSDRILGESTSLTVPATTIMVFTGNNISPRGDLASRSLSVRIAVDRADPENRAFSHTDPVAWTLNNRGAILSALYTILLGNPRHRQAVKEAPRTRFKTWWHLVGSAVEAAALAYTNDELRWPLENGATPAAAAVVDFGKLFLVHETDDEQTSALAGILDILGTIWPDKKAFTAAEVARLINSPMQGEEERGGVLKGLLDQVGDRRAAMSVVSPYAVSTRLRAVADAPVNFGGNTAILKRDVPLDQKHGTVTFRVAIGPSA